MSCISTENLNQAPTLQAWCKCSREGTRGFYLYWLKSQLQRWASHSRGNSTSQVNRIVVLSHMAFFSVFAYCCTHCCFVISIWRMKKTEVQIIYEKDFVLLLMFCIVFFSHQALIRLLSSFAVISPPPDKFLRRPPFNTKGGRLTYGTFYWLCCFLVWSSIPYALSSPPLCCGRHIAWP